MKLGYRVMVISFFGAIIACSAAPIDPGNGEEDDTGGQAVPKSPKGDGGGSTTPPPSDPPPPPKSTCGTDDFIKPDLSTLTPCGNGKGHCYDKTKFELSAVVEPCADASQVCVPDDILNSGGAKPKSCTSIIGAGGCVTAPLFPEIEKQGASALKQDVCDAGQLCVPCVDPTHSNAPTPFCLPIGVHKNACGGAPPPADAGPPPAQCCTHKGVSHGTCLPESAIPAAQQKSTAQQECPTGEKCAPTSLVTGKPVNCDAGFIFGKGVCLDTCFNQNLSIAGDIGLLSGDGCDQHELCIPCSFVKGQGVPGC